MVFLCCASSTADNTSPLQPIFGCIPRSNTHDRALEEIPLNDLVLWLDQLRMTDLGKVGGKNASLGEMIGNLAKLGVSVPGGFATTADAFQQYLEKSGLAKRIQERLARSTWTMSTHWSWRQGDPRLDRRYRPARRTRAGDSRRLHQALQGRRRRRYRRRRALVRHGRRFAGRLVRRPAGNLPQRGRHRRRAAQGEGSFRLAL
jgi:hypothetical protein